MAGRSSDSPPLSRRERQIMDVIYAAGECTAAQVLASLPDPPGYSAVRALLRILEDKGHLKHRSDAGRYVYSARRTREKAARSALQRMLHTFFDNSAAKAMAALLDVTDTKLSDAEFAELSRLIKDSHQKKGGGDA